MSPAKVLYFSGEIPQGDPEGDQRDLFRKLHLLSKEKDHTILASFLDSVTSALRGECSQLNRAQKDVMPSFESVLDLTDYAVQLRKTPLGGAVERVLVLVFQLGSFIAYVSRITSDEEACWCLTGTMKLTRPSTTSRRRICLSSEEVQACSPRQLSGSPPAYQ